MKSFLILVLILNLFMPKSLAGGNPFAEVPASHWAYDALMRLAAEGIVEGYGDGTFKGRKIVTRYEMAQTVARAMSKDVNKKNPTLLILAAEFRSELQNSGVKIAGLEKVADKMRLTGKVSYQYLHTRTDGGIRDTSTSNHFNYFKVELYPVAEVNRHWSAGAKIETYTNYNYKDKTADSSDNKIKLARIFAEGNFNKLTLQFGRVPVLSENDYNMLTDSEASGGQVIFGDKFKFKLFAGRFAGLPYQFAEIYNPRSEKITFGVGFHKIKNAEYREIQTTANGFYDSDAAKIFTAGVGFNFDDKFAVKGSLAKNPSGRNYAETQRRAFSVEVNYKNAGYGIFAAYRKLGHMAVINPVYDVSIIGLKGFHFGGEFNITDNLSAELQYFVGERVSPRWQGKHTNKIFGKVEWNF